MNTSFTVSAAGDTTAGDVDLDLDAFMTRMEQAGYFEWLVIEQEVFLTEPYDFARSVEEHRRNRDTLAPLGLGAVGRTLGWSPGGAPDDEPGFNQLLRRVAVPVAEAGEERGGR